MKLTHIYALQLVPAEDLRFREPKSDKLIMWVLFGFVESGVSGAGWKEQDVASSSSLEQIYTLLCRVHTHFLEMSDE